MDDTLSAVDMTAMRSHLERCEACARHDTRVRRSLLLVRNAPRLECSADFGARLQARLREMGPVERCGTATAPVFPTGFRFSSLAIGLAAAAAVATLATVLTYDRPVPEVRMSPVVAALPEAEPHGDHLPATVSNPAYVASVMSGMPVWPAVLLAGQSSMHSAAYEFQLAGYGK